MNRWQDLELRLAPSFLLKEGTLASSIVRNPPEFIIIDDDDDDDDEEDDEEIIYAPTTIRETRSFFPCPSSPEHAILEGDLDLRLAVGESNGSYGNANGEETCAKKCHECGQATRGNFTREFTEVKLRCAICMDTMKEETSTLCGHIFCKPCITSTILALKKCPTCRKELSITSIHRIFLPGETS